MSDPLRDGAPVVFVDADNTLWDTDEVFAAAQLGLLNRMEALAGTAALIDDRLGYVRAIDQDLASSHHEGLRYPPHLLANALGLALSGQPARSATRAAYLGATRPAIPKDDVQRAVDDYLVALRRRPALRPGVAQGMADLHRAGVLLLIVSESARARVTATAKALGLAGHFSRIIEGVKRPELYTRILRLTGSPANAYMIGDQLDRDIEPAKKAGLTTVYFPSSFTPRWAPSEERVRPDFRIANFCEVVDIALNRVGRVVG